jgi:hypothetical protein
LLELAQVETGGEGVTGSRDDDRLDFLVAGEGIQRVRELVAQGNGERVLLLGPVECEGRDTFLRARPQNERVAHVTLRR